MKLVLEAALHEIWTDVGLEKFDMSVEGLDEVNIRLLMHDRFYTYTRPSD